MKWTRVENIVCEELGAEALLVNPANGGRWSLNKTAAALWRMCDGRQNATDLARALQCSREEVAAFCARFNELGLMRPALAGMSEGGTLTPMTNYHGAPGFKALGLGNGPRRRPNPRGVSGPG